MLLLFPGKISPQVRLQDVLRERHEHLRSLEAKDVARRTAARVPLTDDVDWPAVQRAASAGDARAVFDGVSRAATVSPLGEYEPIAGYDDVFVRFIAVSDARRQGLLVDVAVAAEERAAASALPFSRETALAVVAADAKMRAAQIAFIRDTVKELKCGGADVNVGDDAACEAIASTGALLTHLYVAARDYQTLPPGKAPRFG